MNFFSSNTTPRLTMYTPDGAINVDGVVNVGSTREAGVALVI